jgi:hypothetical protein
VAGWSEGRFYISIISDLSECVTDLGSAEIGVELTRTRVLGRGKLSD